MRKLLVIIFVPPVVLLLLSLFQSCNRTVFVCSEIVKNHAIGSQHCGELELETPAIPETDTGVKDTAVFAEGDTQ